MKTSIIRTVLVLAALTLASPALAAPATVDTLRSVNDQVNAIPKTTPAKWSRPEHGGGDAPGQGYVWDCEDYAREKRDRLSRRGVRALELVTTTPEGIAHAMLYVELDGQQYVLDNIHKKVMPVAEALVLYPSDWRFR